MNNSVICPNCNESYDSYLEKCPKCGAINNSNNNGHVFNQSFLAPPKEKPVEEAPVQSFVSNEQVQQVSLTAIASDPRAELTPNSMPTFNPEPIPIEPVNASPVNIPLAGEEVPPENVSLTEIAYSHRASTDSNLTMNNMPNLDVEVHVAKPENVSLMDIANNYKPANSNMLSNNMDVVDNNQSLTDIANNYKPVNTDMLMANSNPNPSVVPMGQGGSSLTDIANNYRPANNDIFKTNVSNDVFNSPSNPNIPQDDVNKQVGVPSVANSSVVTQEELDNLKPEEFSPMTKLKYVLVFLLVLAGLNFIFLFMAEFNLIWLIIRIMDVVLAMSGYIFAMKNDKRAGLIGLLCGIRLVCSIISFGILDLLLGILTILVSIEVIKDKK